MKVKLVEIKDTIIQKLTNGFSNYNIYGEKDESGFSKPALLVKVYPTSMSMENKYHRRKSINVEISFYSLKGTNQEELECADKIYEIFDSVMIVNNRKFTVGIIQTMIIDGILTLCFNIDFTDSIDETEAYDYEEYQLMEELQMKEEF